MLFLFFLSFPVLGGEEVSSENCRFLWNPTRCDTSTRHAADPVSGRDHCCRTIAFHFTSFEPVLGRAYKPEKETNRVGGEEAEGGSRLYHDFGKSGVSPGEMPLLGPRPCAKQAQKLIVLYLSSIPRAPRALSAEARRSILLLLYFILVVLAPGGASVDTTQRYFSPPRLTPPCPVVNAQVRSRFCGFGTNPCSCRRWTRSVSTWIHMPLLGARASSRVLASCWGRLLDVLPVWTLRVEAVGGPGRVAILQP